MTKRNFEIRLFSGFDLTFSHPVSRPPFHPRLGPHVSVVQPSACDESRVMLAVLCYRGLAVTCGASRLLLPRPRRAVEFDDRPVAVFENGQSKPGINFASERCARTKHQLSWFPGDFPTVESAVDSHHLRDFFHRRREWSHQGRGIRKNLQDDLCLGFVVRWSERVSSHCVASNNCP